MITVDCFHSSKHLRHLGDVASSLFVVMAASSEILERLTTLQNEGLQAAHFALSWIKNATQIRHRLHLSAPSWEDAVLKGVAKGSETINASYRVLQMVNSGCALGLSARSALGDFRAKL
jgi:hypothetical protein